MNEEKILGIIQKFSKKLPHFPDGRINYSSSRTAPVINVVVKHKDKILLLKRSDKVNSYKGKWNTIGGYLDELKPVKEKVFEELREELGIKCANENIYFGEIYEFHDTEIGKTWIICPVLVEFPRKPRIRLDWEHTDYSWVKPEEISHYDTVPKLGDVLDRVINAGYKKLLSL